MITSINSQGEWQLLLLCTMSLQKTLSGSFQARDYVQSVEEVARSAQRLESDVRENPAAWNLDLEVQL